MKKFEDIIERIEYVRKYLSLNKSRFSSGIGMKPQTYNNFIGSQGSKPNIELIRGIVNRYAVNPTWLLNGSGEVFTDEASLAHAVGGEHLHVAEGEGDTLSRKLSDSLNDLQLQLKSLDPVLSQADDRIRELKAGQQPLVEGLARIMEKYLEIDPVGANREIRIFIQKLDLRLHKLR